MKTPISRCRAKNGPLSCRYHSSGVSGGIAAKISQLEQRIETDNANGVETPADVFEELSRRKDELKLAQREIDSRKLHQSLFRQMEKLSNSGTEDIPHCPKQLEMDGRVVDVIRGHRLPESTRRLLRKNGYGCPDLMEISPSGNGAPLFHDLMEKTRVGKFASSVWVYDEDEYANMRLFVGRHGECGYALKTHDDGTIDIVSVFSMPKNSIKAISDITDEEFGQIEPRISQSMLLSAVANGGRVLDCFDTVLPQLYASVGFKEYSRDSWNEEYKPEGWDYDTYKSYNNGRPDVVYMRWDPSAWASPTLLHSAQIDYEELERD